QTGEAQLAGVILGIILLGIGLFLIKL
ncbi:MAG TPA: LPXTG cell wall anchor domain-containing protein, partial [Candidatus Aenigmarchaeota archaeon]|nr:LPXTG cell wall anchor domain-containing protein [Candidatus Aenigmarchaeota archaeon]